MKTLRSDKWNKVDEEERELLAPPSEHPGRKPPVMKILLGTTILCAFGLTVVSLCRSSFETSAPEPASQTHVDEFTLLKRSGVTWKTNEARKKAERQNACEGALNPGLAREIEGYQETVNRIIKHVTEKGRGETWRQLSDFVDAHGPRFTGTEGLEHAIDDRLNYLRRIAGPENVVAEPVKVPVWIRGETEVVLLNAWSGNRNKTMDVLTLGYSVGTPTPEGFTAEAVVVESFEELETLSNVSGKIVVFNQEYVSYGQTVIYRSQGASKAAAKGAVAALIRSVTDYSLYTPHTGMMSYVSNATQIPAISITVEDAELLSRKQQRGETLEIYVRSTARMAGSASSRNLVAEIPGSEQPEEFVIISGHIDSWDVGQGAMDDGGGAAISWRAIEVLKLLDVKPRRTVKTVLFTAEELGTIGGLAYFQKHKGNASRAQLILESDIGTFTPLGLSIGIKNEKAVCIIKKVLQLFGEINATALDPQNDGPDIGSWFKLGVPGGSLFNKNENYFRYHHTNADTMHMMEPASLDKATALWAGVAFVFADLDARIPHDPPAHQIIKN